MEKKVEAPRGDSPGVKNRRSVCHGETILGKRRVKA